MVINLTETSVGFWYVFRASPLPAYMFKCEITFGEPDEILLLGEIKF